MPINTSGLTAQQQITAIYVAYYDRAPDPAGLQFWTDQLQGGRSLEQIATDFSGAAETKAKFPFFDAPDVASADTFITSIYVNLFGRTPDDAGRDFWSAQLESGSTPVGEIILAILEGAQDVASGGFPDSETITNKIDVGLDWAQSAIDAGLGLSNNPIAEEIEGQVVVNNQAAFNSATNILDQVDETAQSVADAKAETDAFIAGDNTGVNFTLTASSASVDEGDSATFTLNAPSDVADGEIFTWVVGGDVNASDIEGGQLTGTVTINNGVGTIQIPLREDQRSEGAEDLTLTILGTVGDTAPSATVTVNDTSTAADRTIILTATQDEVTPTSADPDKQTTDGDDLIIAGSVESGGAHTLGAADTINGGPGSDTIRIVEDRASATTLFPRMSNVENAELQALEDMAVDFNNTTGIETLVADRSVADTTVTNLRDDVDFELNDTANDLNVGYSAIDPVNPTELDVAFNNAQGATLNLTNQGAGVQTLNLSVNGGDTVFGNGAGEADITGIGGNTGSLTSLNLSGTSNVVIERQTANDLTTKVTAVDATLLAGSLNLDLLGNNNDLTFEGGESDTRLVVGTGDNTVNFGGGDDRLILSSTGLNGNDAFNGGEGDNTLEVHFNNGSPSTNLSGTYAALNASSDIQNLVVDVWNQSNESVTLDQDMLAGSVENVIIQDTSDETGGGNGVRNGSLGNTTTLNNVASGVSYILLADDVTDVVASGSDLDLTLRGLDSAGVAGDDDTINRLDLTGLTGTANVELVNTASTFVDESTNTGIVGSNTLTTSAGQSSLDDVLLAANGVLNLSGDVTRFEADINAGTDITVDASAINTIAGTLGVANNVIDASTAGVLRADITGTAQDDDITGTSDDDIIRTGEGDNIVNTLDGDDTVIAGDGADQITVGQGIVNVSAGGGNDEIIFASQTAGNLTSADIVDGGDGRDTLRVNNTDETLLDGVFNQITNVEVLDVGFGTSVTLNAIANNRAFDTIVLNDAPVGYVGPSAGSSVFINEGFVRDDLQVNLSSFGDDTVQVQQVPATSATAITVNTLDFGLDVNDTILGGSSDGDVLNITAANGTANASGVRNVETINLQSTIIPNGADTTFLLGDYAVANSADTLTIDASGMVNASGNTADATIDVSENPTFTGSLASATRFDITTGEGNDTVYGSTNADTITSTGGNDTIYAGGGADTIDVGGGDVEVTYGAVSDSQGLLTNIDTISNFEVASGGNLGDVIVIDDDLVAPGTNLVFKGNAVNAQDAQAAVNAAAPNETAAVFQSDENILWVDVNRDGTLNNDDLRIKLDGVTAITAADIDSRDVQIDSAGTFAQAPLVPQDFQIDNDLFGNEIIVDGAGTGATTFAAAPTVQDNVDTLRLGGTTDLSGAGLPGNDFASVTLDPGAVLTMDLSQHNEFVDQATTSKVGQQTVNVTNGSFTGVVGIESYGIDAGNTFTLGTAGQNVSENGAGNTTVDLGGFAATGSFSNFEAGDSLLVDQSGSVSSVNGGAALGMNTVNFGNNNVTLTSTVAQHNGLTSAIGTVNTQTWTLSDSGILTGRTGIENYVFTNTGTNVFTVGTQTSVDVDGSGTMTIDVGGNAVNGTYTEDGSGLADTVMLTNGGDISQASISGYEIFDITGAVTMTTAQHNDFNTFTAPGGSDLINLTTSGTLTGASSIETYEVQGGSNFTLGDDGQNVTEDTGGFTTVDIDGRTITGNYSSFDANDTLFATTGANLSGGNSGAALGFGTLSMTGIITMTEAQHNGFNIINAAGPADQIQITDTFIGTADNDVETYDLNDLFGNDITVNGPGVNVEAGFDNDVVRVNGTLGAVSIDGEGEIGSPPLNALNDLGDTIALSNGADISAATIQDFEFYGLENSGSFTVSAAQHADIVTQGFSGNASFDASGTETLTISNAITGTEIDEIENYVLSSGDDTFTFTQADADATLRTVDLGGGSDTLIIDNDSIEGTEANDYVTISNFQAGDDILSSQVGGTAHNSAYQTITSGGSNLTVGANSVVEIETGVATALTLTDVSDGGGIESIIASAVTDSTSVGANNDLTFAVYDGLGNAGLYQATIGVADADLDTADFSIELVGIVDGVGSDALSAANFA